MPWEGCEILELPDGTREFRLHEQTLNWIRIDHQTRLQFGKAELVIECPFSLDRAGDVSSLDPSDRAGLGQLLRLYPDVAAHLGMSPDGTLTVKFESGAALTVPPHPSYEAWSICGFWCPPGGFAP